MTPSAGPVWWGQQAGRLPMESVSVCPVGRHVMLDLGVDVGGTRCVREQEAHRLGGLADPMPRSRRFHLTRPSLALNR